VVGQVSLQSRQRRMQRTRIVTRQTEADLGVLRDSVETCAAACRTSADECDRRASHHEHCRLCAESWRRWEEACNVLLAAIGTGGSNERGSDV
jgi:hypothetical protein